MKHVDGTAMVPAVVDLGVAVDAGAVAVFLGFQAQMRQDPLGTQVMVPESAVRRQKIKLKESRESERLGSLGTLTPSHQHRLDS